jgi:transcriptional regulator with XRE-family HTH domain
MQLGLTQEELAKRMGTSHSVISARGGRGYPLSHPGGWA